MSLRAGQQRDPVPPHEGPPAAMPGLGPAPLAWRRAAMCDAQAGAWGSATAGFVAVVVYLLTELKSFRANAVAMYFPRLITTSIARCRAGSTSVEYGLVASLIAGAAQAGNSISGAFAELAAAMEGPADEPLTAQGDSASPPPMNK